MNAPAEPPDGLPAPRRQLAYTAVIIAITLSVMDASVANVALPTIARDFHATPSVSISIVSAYQLAIVISLLPLAALGEIHGYRRVYKGGLILFTAASIACVFSRSIEMLTAARILQGFGAAGIMSVNTALIRYIFPHNRLGRAIGINALVVAVASTIGPTFASIVLGIASWPWLFAVNLPLGIAAFAIGARNLPESERADRRFDILSAVLSALTFGMIVTSIDSISRGAPKPILAAQILIGALAAFWGVRRQRAMPAPLLPVDLLRRPVFGLAIGTSICSFTAQMLAFVSLPFYLQTNMGFRASTIGFLIMPWPLAVAITAPIAGRLSDRYPASVLAGLGLGLLAAGLFLLAVLPAHPQPGDIVWRMAICGAGFGMFQSPNNRAIITAAPRTRSGAASGTLGTARLLGQASGAALVGLMLADFLQRGAVMALYTAAGFALAAAMVSLARIGITRRDAVRARPG